MDLSEYRWPIIIGIVIVVMIIVLIFIVIIYRSRNLLFNTRPVDKLVSPELKHSNIMISTPSGRVNAWWFNNHAGAKTILFCHGNAGNIGDLVPFIYLCDKLGVNLVLFDYSSYGMSSGQASQATVKENAVYVYQYLLDHNIPEDDIIVWGMSLGGAVAAYLAATFNPSYLILMSTFASLDNLADGKELIRTIILMTGEDMLDTNSLIASIKCPILILHSKEDKFISYANAQKLYQTCVDTKGPCQCTLIDIQGGHSSPVITIDTLASINEVIGLDNKNVALVGNYLDQLSHLQVTV